MIVERKHLKKSTYFTPLYYGLINMQWTYAMCTSSREQIPVVHLLSAAMSNVRSTDYLPVDAGVWLMLTFMLFKTLISDILTIIR